MKKTWIKAVVGTVGVALVVLILWMLVDREPTYQDRTARQWLTQFDRNGGQATEAIRNLGAQALPALIHELRAQDGAGKLKLLALLKKQSLIKIQFTPDAVRRERAIKACAALGPLARPAIPALGEALGHGSGSALGVLEAFGPEAIESLATALTNAPGCSPPYAIAGALGRMGVKARVAVTNLVWEFEHHTVGPPRTLAARTFTGVCRELIETENQFYCPEVAHAKAALIRGLANTNSYIRLVSINSLAVFKSHAGDATEPLLALLNDPDRDVRRAVINALRVLEPEALTLAGITR